MGFTPSSGDEIQSEFFVARSNAVDAIHAIRRVAEALRPVLQVSEIRTIAADSLWTSPQYGRDSVGIHFTWRNAPDVARAVAVVEEALSPFDARPHWGKVFTANAQATAERYERLPAFIDLLERVDPGRVFRNDWLDANVLGTA